MNLPSFRLIVASLLVLGHLLVGCRDNPVELRNDLFKALKNSDSRKVEQLIKKGVDINTPETPGGWSPLHFAASVGNVEITEALLAAGANPNYVGTAPNQTGTRFSLKPLVVAQAGAYLAKSAQTNPFLHLADPVAEKRMKDPKAAAELERICSILEKVTTKQ